MNQPPSLRSDLPLPPSPQWPARSTAELLAVKPAPDAYAAMPRAPMSVLLDDVRSLANVGLVFRLCDALRVERLYLCGITGHPAFDDPSLDPRARHVQERAAREINRTAVMAVPFVPWEYHADRETLMHSLRTRGVQLVALEQAHGSVPYARAGIYRPPLCLILGHERAGVTPLALQQADLCVELPVFGMANSLNVAMSLAIVGYEVLRQHDGFGLHAL